MVVSCRTNKVQAAQEDGRTKGESAARRQIDRRGKAGARLAASARRLSKEAAMCVQKLHKCFATRSVLAPGRPEAQGCLYRVRVPMPSHRHTDGRFLFRHRRTTNCRAVSLEFEPLFSKRTRWRGRHSASSSSEKCQELHMCEISHLGARLLRRVGDSRPERVLFRTQLWPSRPNSSCVPGCRHRVPRHTPEGPAHEF